MTLALYDRVQQTGTANTTVSFTLSGSVAGYQSFVAVGNGNTTYYGSFDTSGNWEVGLGTYSTTGPTLTRTTILSSSNGGLAVTFSGTVNVFITYPSEKSVNQDANGNVGIGTSSPSQVLSINSAGGYPIIDFKSGGVAKADIGFNTGTGTYNVSAYSTIPMAFYTNSAERMRIDSSGNVGIGTTTPVVSLEVNGQIKAATAANAGLISLGEANNGTAVNVGIWRGAAGVYGTGGNALGLGGYDGISFTSGNVAIGSQTERMRITSAGLVGVGTNNPQNLLHAVGSITLTTDSTYPIAAGDSSSIGKRMVMGYFPTGSSGNNGFGVIQSVYTGVQWSPTVINPNGGNVLIGTSTNNTSGGVLQVSNGITFPATQSASSDANTLDDYEEGTWTPSLTFNGTSTGITYGARNASYVKIGQFVYCSFNLILTNKGSSTGSSGLTGLPFVAGGIVTYPMAASNIFGLTSTTQTMLQIATGGTNMEIKFSGLDSNPTDTLFSNSTQIRAAFVYQANA